MIADGCIILEIPELTVFRMPKIMLKLEALDLKM
jgi:hypothetical protein